MKNNSVSLAYLTVDFLGVSSVSVNYYIATLLRDIEKHISLDRLTIFSHKSEDSYECSLSKVMADFGLSHYSKKVNIKIVNCFDFLQEFDELKTYNLIVSTFFLWGEVAEKLKTKLTNPPKVIYWVPSILFQEYIANGHNKWYKFDLVVELQKKMIKYADDTIWNSQSDLQNGKKYFGKLIQNSHVIYPTSIIQNNKTLNSVKSNSHEQIIFGWAGRWDYRKGIHLLVDSFFHYFAEERNASLSILSNYLNDEFELEEMLEDLSQQEFKLLYQCGAIQLNDWKRNRKEYLNFLQSCHVMIFPSLYDPFNIIAYDCLALNIPIILSRFCGVEELIETETEYLIKVNPLDTEETYLAMKRIGTMVRDHSLAKIRHPIDTQKLTKEMLEKTFTLYKEILN